MERAACLSMPTGMCGHFQHLQCDSRFRQTPHVVRQLASHTTRTADRRLASVTIFSPAAIPHAWRRLHGRHNLRGCKITAAVQNCPMCGSSIAPDPQGSRWPCCHYLAPGRKRTARTAAGRGMLSSEFAPEMSSSPGTESY